MCYLHWVLSYHSTSNQTTLYIQSNHTLYSFKNEQIPGLKLGVPGKCPFFLESMCYRHFVSQPLTQIIPCIQSNQTLYSWKKPYSTQRYTFWVLYYSDIAHKSIFFEGSVDDANETNLTVANPTASRTITLPDATGTVALTNTTAYATSSIFSSAVTLLIKDSSGSTLKTIVGSAT